MLEIVARSVISLEIEGLFRNAERNRLASEEFDRDSKGGHSQLGDIFIGGFRGNVSGLAGHDGQIAVIQERRQRV